MKNSIFAQKKISISYKMLYLLGFGLLALGMLLLGSILYNRKLSSTIEKGNFWKFESIDTMKYSRDLAREKLGQPLFNLVIDQQMKDIASTGATHVAIATPYDSEFFPILKLWVDSARKYNLKVWFRGNFSGWEGWFDYPKITREQHLQMTSAFLKEHPEIFADGDIFSACPECENGGPGNPTQTGDIAGHRHFLIEEYKITKEAFSAMGKVVASNYDSMNKDVADKVMDSDTTTALDGIVTIDHYVASPEKLAKDIDDLAQKTGGRIVLGEFGAPIPDINGDMTEEQQAEWISRLGKLLVNSSNLEGLSYWVNMGGSTKLWNDDNSARKAVAAIEEIYNPKQLYLVVSNEAGEPINSAKVSGVERFVTTRNDGKVMLPYIDNSQEVTISAANYKSATYTLSRLSENNTAVLEKNYESSLFKLKKFLKRVFPFI